MQKKRKWFGIKMILPAFLLMAVFLLYPLFTGISYSVTSYRLDRPGKTKLVFLENFIKILTSDSDFYESFGFTFIYAFGTVILAYLVGFAIALLLNQDVWGRGIFRALILLPWIISSSVTATNWKWLLNDRYGLINNFLLDIGVIDSPILFLAKPMLAKMTVIAIGAWKALPFMTIVILAGLQSVPGELYEAASIDGAGFWKRMKYVTLPEISGITTMCTTLQFIWNFNNFENIYLMTSGGPNSATYTLPIYIYQSAFARNKIAYASAIAVIILILMIIFTICRMRLQKGKRDV